ERGEDRVVASVTERRRGGLCAVVLRTVILDSDRVVVGRARPRLRGVQGIVGSGAALERLPLSQEAHVVGAGTHPQRREKSLLPARPTRHDRSPAFTRPTPART